MHFAPFTRVNHHMQSIQFGCALLQDEIEVNFTWLFQTWLESMGGCPPISIITDQDLAMKAAIAKVFPNTRTVYAFGISRRNLLKSCHKCTSRNQH